MLLPVTWVAQSGGGPVTPRARQSLLRSKRVIRVRTVPGPQSLGFAVAAMISSGVRGDLRHKASITWLSAAEIWIFFAFMPRGMIQMYFRVKVQAYCRRGSRARAVRVGRKAF